MSTSDYYKKNPAARKRRNAQQTRYNKSGKGNKIPRKGKKYSSGKGRKIS